MRFRREFRLPLRSAVGCGHVGCAICPIRFVPRLRPFTGKDPKVRRYIRSFQDGGIPARIEVAAYLIPHYIREGKVHLTCVRMSGGSTVGDARGSGEEVAREGSADFRPSRSPRYR